VLQPLTPIHRIRLNLRTLETSIQLAEERTRQERLDVVQNVKKAYYGIQQAKSSLVSVRETRKLYQELERLTSDYVKQEAALPGDLLQVQTRVAQTDQMQMTLEDQEAGAKEQLNQLLGRDVLTEFDVSTVMEADEIESDITAARKRALEMRSEVRQARLKNQQAAQDARAKRAEYIPDIAIDFSNLTLLNYNRFLPVQSTSIGLSLFWEPFDWGARSMSWPKNRGRRNRLEMPSARRKGW